MRHAYLTVFIVLFVLSFSEPLNAGFIEVTPPFAISRTGVHFAGPEFQYATENVWRYLRLGLNYLESPLPLSPPEAVPPSYIHPDSKGFGAYGLSPAAYGDVQRLYPYFRDYKWEEVLSSPGLYDLSCRAFADHIIRNLQDYILPGAENKEIFDVVHKAWNLGLRGYKCGRRVVGSRLRRAEEFKNS